MKVRFDGLDVMAMVSHLNHVALGRRVINIYEGDSSDSFLFKLDHNVNTVAATGSATAATASSNTDANSNTPPEDDAKEKLLLYLESGIRFHTTNRMQNNSVNHNNATKNQPLAPFVFQLRKQLRGLRLESVTQLGQGDRVVHFVFGMGEARRALLLELYAKGNIVLCDSQYRILTLLRSHQYTSGVNNNNNSAEPAGNHHTGAVQVQIGHVYPVTYAARNINIADPGTNLANHNDSVEKDDDATEKQELSVNATSSAQDWTAWAEQQVRQAADLAAAKANAAEEPDASSNNVSNNKKWGKKKGKKDKKQAAGVMTLKTLLLKPSSGISHYGPNFLEHCILMTPNFGQEDNSSKLTPHSPLVVGGDDSNSNLPVTSDWEQFLQVLQEESAKLDIDPKAIAAAPPKGFILYSEKTKKDTGATGDDATTSDDNSNEGDDKKNKPGGTFSDKVLEEFQPYLLLKQHEGRKVIEFDTFNEAVDTFFGHLEAQKRLLRAEAAEQAAKDKLEKVRQDQQHRLQGLERDVHKVQEQAQAVELNADNVEKALQVINSALDSGMDWEQLDQLVQVEQEENHNPIALLIYRLDLEHDSMVLELPTAAAAFDNGEDGSDDEQEDQEDDDKGEKKKNQRGGENAPSKPKVKTNHVLVPISLKETAHGNASAMFAEYRSMKEKSQRTVESSAKALKAAEENAQRQLADAKQRTKQATNTAVGQIIKPPWFTKFHWFITSDNYLVLGGRDAHQNEVLVKKYLRPGDAYLHADVHGAASCILRAKRVRVPVKGKNKKTGATTTQTLPLSDQALREAGNFTICRSSAWASKMVTSAWWVESHQVSKTAPTGEYLKVGAFMIRGRKNFLPPTPLEMGLGIMFRLAAPEGTLDPATYARHKNERRDFALMELLQQQDDDDFNDDGAEDTDGANDAGIILGAENKDENGTKETKEQQTTQQDINNPESEASTRIDKLNAEIAEEETLDCAPLAETSAMNGAEPAIAQEKSPSPATPSPEKKKKGLSVKERKLIKKYGSLEKAEKILAEREKEEQEREKEKQLMAAFVPTGDDDDDDDDDDDEINEQGTMKRGRKGKKKKAMKKYADQDDEDRELAMLALQGGEKVKKTKDNRRVDPTTDEQKQAAAETAALLVKDASDVAGQLPEDVRSVLAECVTVQQKDTEPVVRWEKFDADVLEQLLSFEGPPEAKLAAAKRLLFLKSTTRVDNFSASLSGILRTIRKWGYKQLETDASGNAADGSKRKTNEEKKAADAAWKETLAEEGVAGEEIEDEDADIDDTAENNKLTGKPHAEDALLYALPVCAPYQTLTQYTYRIKLTPGNLKRGKAARQCVDMFLKGDAGNAGNAGKKSSSGTANGGVGKDFIKKVADNDWIQCLCADVKISAPGAAKNIKKQKASNKAKAKKKK